jgi:hypothetical protein
VDGCIIKNKVEERERKKERKTRLTYVGLGGV